MATVSGIDYGRSQAAGERRIL